jgi:hypothetical protein
VKCGRAADGENRPAGSVTGAVMENSPFRIVTNSVPDQFKESSQFPLREFPFFRLPIEHGVANKISKVLQTPLQVGSSRLLVLRLTFESRHQVLCFLPCELGMNDTLVEKLLENGAIQMGQLIKNAPASGQMGNRLPI